MAATRAERSIEGRNGAAAPKLPSAPSRRPKVPMAVAGVLLVAGAALVFGVWGSSLGDRQPVVVAAREIPAGRVITAADLTIAEVDVDSTVAVIPAAERRSLVDQVAAASVPPGALVHPDQVNGGPVVADSDAVVGVAVPAGALPLPDLRVGDRVQVVESSPEEAGESSAEALGSAEVFALRPLDDSTGTVVVSLRLDEGRAVRVAGAAAADRLRLVLVGGGGP